jgi:hypothetical protein
MPQKPLHPGQWGVACALGCVLAMTQSLNALGTDERSVVRGAERQVTQGPGGRILTNTGVWSPDSKWLVYDVRSDPAGDVFDSPRIEAVNVETSEVRVLYTAVNGANCGVVTHHPHLPLVVFILGPEHPSDDWRYGPNHRQGVVLDTCIPDIFTRLDARDLTAATPGALRGGTHVHVWDAAGEWVAYTYNDAVTEPGLRDIGIAVPGHRVTVAPGHPRNHSGEWFSALVTRTVPAPVPDSDEIKRANEEGWIGTNGYLRADGSRQRRAIAFQGQIVTAEHGDVTEVFIVDLPDDLPASATITAALSSTGRLQPLPEARQRRLTHTTGRRYPGIQGTRHWLRSSPDGSRIAFLAKDDSGIVQIWTVSPATGATTQLTHNATDISSAFTWSPDGRWIAHGLNGEVCLTDTETGVTRPIEHRSPPVEPRHPRPIENGAGGDAGALKMRKEACVFSPDGSRIAFVRSGETSTGTTNQICVIELK